MATLNWNHLRVFAAIAENGGVTRAAQALGMSQSAVSQTLLRLETAMDRTLVRREGRGFSLTPMGEAVLADAQAMQTAAERIGLDDALRGYTRDGAWAWHAEQELGIVRRGALADLVVWSGDLYEHESDPAALLQQHAALTIVGGEVVHDAAESAPIPTQYGEGAHSCSDGPVA